jgi:hypothetical protein
MPSDLYGKKVAFLPLSTWDFKNEETLNYVLGYLVKISRRYNKTIIQTLRANVLNLLSLQKK